MCCMRLRLARGRAASPSCFQGSRAPAGCNELELTRHARQLAFYGFARVRERARDKLSRAARECSSRSKDSRAKDSRARGGRRWPRPLKKCLRETLIPQPSDMARCSQISPSVIRARGRWRGLPQPHQHAIACRKGVPFKTPCVHLDPYPPACIAVMPICAPSSSTNEP